MCSQHNPSGKCDAGPVCFDGHLCCFCRKYGHKKVFTEEQEKIIEEFLEENVDLMDDLAKLEEKVLD
jgi:hypothetical protein